MTEQEIKKRANEFAAALGYNTNSISIEVTNVKEAFCAGIKFLQQQPTQTDDPDYSDKQELQELRSINEGLRISRNEYMSGFEKAQQEIERIKGLIEIGFMCQYNPDYSWQQFKTENNL